MSAAPVGRTSRAHPWNADTATACRWPRASTTWRANPTRSRSRARCRPDPNPDALSQGEPEMLPPSLTSRTRRVHAALLVLALLGLASPARAENRLGGHFGVVFPLVTHAHGETTDISEDF